MTLRSTLVNIASNHHTSKQQVLECYSVSTHVMSFFIDLTFYLVYFEMDDTVSEVRRGDIIEIEK